MNKILVTETLVFVKDASVIEYADIADYLTEYRVHREAVRLEKSIYDLGVYNEELEFFFLSNCAIFRSLCPLVFNVIKNKNESIFLCQQISFFSTRILRSRRRR